MSTIIKNVIILTLNQQRQVIHSGFLRFDGTQITQIDEMKNFNEGDFEKHTIIDGEGGILMPGMVNLHSHLGMIPFRGLQDDAVDRLRKFLLPAEKEEMTPELVYASSKYAIAELLLSGVTTVMDMYYFEEETAKAVEEMGIRGFLGQTIIGEPICDAKTPQEALLLSQKLIEKYKHHPLITPCIAPHSPVTCSEEVLIAVKDMAKAYDVPYTIHLSEMDYEINYFRENYNMTPVEYLHQIGFMSENLVAAHCILVNEKDLQILKEAKVAIAHCIGANTKSAKGVAPLKQMLEWGIPVGLGTDGPSSGNTIDVLTQFKLCANFHKNENKDRSAFSARSIVELGTLAGAKALQREAQIGSLEVGKQADLVLVETSSVNMFPLYDPYSALVYSANSSNVAHVFVNGKWVVKDKKLVHEPLAMIRQRLSDLLKNKENGLFSKYLLNH